MFLISNRLLQPVPYICNDRFSKLGETFGKCFQYDLGKVGIFNFIAVVLSFLFVDLFDTLGTLVGVSTKAGMLNEEGKLPGIKPALMADAVATTAGAVLGTSTVTTFVESSSGVCCRWTYWFNSCCFRISYS